MGGFYLAPGRNAIARRIGLRLVSTADVSNIAAFVRLRPQAAGIGPILHYIEAQVGCRWRKQGKAPALCP
jgi:hypothetical protein